MAFRAKRGKRGLEDRIVLDKNKSLSENLREVLKHVVCRDTSDAVEQKKVGYLDALVRFLQQKENQDFKDEEQNLRMKEVMMCLRIPLTSSREEVRSGVLRAIRHLVRAKQDAVALLQVNLHHLLIRCLDLDSDHKPERVQAVKLARKLLIFGPRDFPASLVRCLAAVVTRGEGSKKDDYWRAALALLCELSCINMPLFLDQGLVRVLVTCLLTCHSMPRVTDAVAACLMRIYSHPELRKTSGLDLSLIVSPYTELPHTDSQDSQANSRLESAATTLLSLTRSWPGLLHLTSPHLSTQPLQSLLDSLYLPSYQTRSTILDLVFRSLSLQVPDWTDEFDVAMKTADPSASRAQWRLGEGFTVAEGYDILPHLAKSRPNLVESHTALLLSAYLKAGLPSALIEVIVTGDTVLSVRAAVLLGQFLHLVSLLLPHEISSVQLCLPQLTRYVDTSQPDYCSQKSTKALAAVTGLHKLHCLKRHGHRPSSLLLEQVMEYSGQSSSAGGQFVGDRLKGPSLPASNDAAGERQDLVNIKESGVITHRDPQSWRWDLVLSTLKWPGDLMRRMEDTSCKLFLKNLTDFYLPSLNMFSRMELESGRTRYLARVGQSLLDFLVTSLPVGLPSLPMNISGSLTTSQEGKFQEPEAGLRLDVLLTDIIKCIQELISSPNPHNCVLSPTRLTNTACQYYFLFLGRLSRSESGRQYLDKHSTLSLLAELLRVRHDVYLKLVISAIDYRHEDWGSRTSLLVKGLTTGSEQGRIYSTRWLGVLARLGVPNIAVYGVELLVRQLMDESLVVASTALNILDEVCDDKMFLESLVSNSSVLLSPAGKHALEVLGDRGRLLLTRCVGSIYGFSLMSSNNWLAAEILAWASDFNIRYVLLVESLVNEVFSLHQRGEDGLGTYGRRSGEFAGDMRTVMVPPHLYGQLALTKQGLELLLAENAFWEMLVLVQEIGTGNYRRMQTENDQLRVKAAIWGVANVAASSVGSKLLEQKGVIVSLVNIAETCPYLSISGTAFYAMGLVACTTSGSESLATRGWVTIRHVRGDTWHVARDWLQQVEPVDKEQSNMGGMTPSPGVSDSEDVGLVRTNTQSSDTGTVVLVNQSPSKKIGDKITSWFRDLDKKSSSNGKTKQTRRNSEGSKGSSSGFASRFRKSFREKRASIGSGTGRPRTTSVGSMPSKENTPIGSLGVTGESSMESKQSSSNTGQYRRKLSFGHDMEQDLDQEVNDPSPGDLPGEMFLLDNIKEEPEIGAKETTKAGDSEKNDMVRMISFSTSSSGVSSQSAVAKTQDIGGLDDPPNISVSEAINIEATLSPVSPVTPSNQSVGSADMSAGLSADISGQSVPRLEPVITLPEIIARGGDIAMLGAIKQGTSVSSVSSIGSYSFTENPGYATRTRKRRPQLSESEDGEHVSGRGTSYTRDNFTRNTLPTRGHRAGTSDSVTSVHRSMSVPPKILHNTLPKFDTKDPSHYWGLAFPLNSDVLQPNDGVANQSPAFSVSTNQSSAVGHVNSCQPMPLQLSLVFTNSLYQHDPGQCLVCYKNQEIVRPRSSSLNSSQPISTSSSTHASDVRRQSCFSLHTGLVQKCEQAPDVTSPTDKKEAMCEALHLISCLNNTKPKIKQAEASLLRLQRKWPQIFSDLCFFSDVCCLLSQFQFRSSSRKFIQELFLELNVDQIYLEAVNFLENKS